MSFWVTPARRRFVATITRTVDDATRFTATLPHAHSKPSPPRPKSAAGNGAKQAPRKGSTMPSMPKSSPGPPGETPAQKVARLRAEWRRKNIPEPPLWDKVVVIGRNVADTAHNMVILTIIGSTVVITLFTIYTLTDMFRYNRAKKREFFETQTVLYHTALEESRAALARGEANENHLMVLENERLASLEDERKRKLKPLKQIYEYLFTNKNMLAEEGLNEIELEKRYWPLRPPPKEGQMAADEEKTEKMGFKRGVKDDAVLRAVGKVNEEETRAESTKAAEVLPGTPAQTSEQRPDGGKDTSWSGWLSSFWR